MKPKKPENKTFVGFRHGFLTIVEIIDGRTCRAQCDCGEIVTIGRANIAHSTKSCGCYRRSGVAQQAGADAVKLPVGIAARNAVVEEYRHSAKKRKLHWLLPEYEVNRLLQGDCYYCGAPPSRKVLRNFNGAFLCNGIDRLDNSLGYELNNVVSCCITCNRAKYTMTETEFFEWVKQIYRKQVEQREKSKSVGVGSGDSVSSSDVRGLGAKQHDHAAADGDDESAPNFNK